MNLKKDVPPSPPPRTTVSQERMIEILDNALKVVSETNDFVEDDLEKNKVMPSHCEGFKPQSGTTDDNIIMKVIANETHQNVSFTDNDDPYMYSVKGRMDATRSLQDTSGDDLGSFFSRPIKIFEEEWQTNGSVNVVVDPWTAFLSNPRVSNRMTNFNLFRARMRVKFLINGNSFHYGRAIALYHPQHSRDDFTELGSTFSLVQGSQMPHVFLDPTTSTGGELCLPFFCEKNNVNLPSAEYTNLGRVHIISLNDLRHANGASDKATITVFAWLEDVELNMLTSVDMPYEAQSGLEVDEANRKGTISGPATAVAKMAANLAQAPIIGPYAMATSQLAGATARMAKLFGYSRPPVTKDPDPYKPVAISNMATTTVPDHVAKLTVDDKQEITIDPTISGIGPGDPLNIKQIAKRESYLTTFAWQVGEAPETLLWNARVAPTLWALEGSGIYLPACAMAALPFKYWTGTMKFRFQIVASAFHKGRLKVVYDPNFISSNEYNTNYVEIIDMAEKQDFTIEIGNGQHQSLLTSPTPNGSPFSHYRSSPSLGISQQGNGILSLYVVNELTTPDTSAPRDISVNVFISMGDDFEVFVPDDRFQAYMFKPQSGFEPQSGQENEVNDALVAHDPSPPQQGVSDFLGVGTTNHEDLNKVFIGEAIQSFRPLLKRYNLHSNVNATFNSDRRVLYGTRTSFPFLRGPVADAVHRDDNNDPYNYCNTVLLHWVTLAFSGYRGSIRWKIIPQSYLQQDSWPITYVERDTSTRHYTNGRTSVFTPTNENQMAFQAVWNPVFPANNRPLPGTKGMMYSNGYVNPNAEFEVPFYSDDRFIPGKRENYTAFNSLDELNTYSYRIFVRGNNETYFNGYVAAGEDFQVYFWTGLPKVYYQTSPPSANV